jgi:hypothetical protein
MNTFKTSLFTLLGCAFFATKLFLISFVAPALAASDAHAAHITIAIVQQNGDPTDLDLPIDAVKGHLVSDVGDKGTLMLLAHSASLRDGSTFNISNDILNMHNGKMEDTGIDCQFFIHILESIPSISGVCEYNMVDHDGAAHEAKYMLSSSDLKTDGSWILLSYDDNEGVAIYAAADLEQ